MEYAKLTGNVDGQYVQVFLPSGMNFYAPIVTMGTTVTLPSKSWIAEHKNDVLAIVDYIKDDLDKPIIIGYRHVEGSKSAINNSFERLLSQVQELVNTLREATINTSSGATPFMPQVQEQFSFINEELNSISNQINTVSL